MQFFQYARVRYIILRVFFIRVSYTSSPLTQGARGLSFTALRCFLGRRPRAVTRARTASREVTPDGHGQPKAAITTPRDFFDLAYGS